METRIIKTNLKATEQNQPHFPPQVHAFAAHLADRLPEEIYPQGFCNAAGWALSDVKKGKSSMSQTSLPKELEGLSKEKVAEIESHLVQLARAAGDEDITAAMRAALGRKPGN